MPEHHSNYLKHNVCPPLREMSATLCKGLFANLRSSFKNVKGLKKTSSSTLLNAKNES